MTVPSTATNLRHTDIAIIGAGFSGLGMAARLQQRGFDYLVFERGTEVGGTWRDNNYPGAACDIRSDVYSYSFAPNPNWTRTYSTQPEILDYLRRTADERGLRSNIEFGHELERAVWDAAANLWRLAVKDVTPDAPRTPLSVTARVLISGAGPLIDPAWPAIPGLESFTGERFHSARWRHDIDLAGKRVAVIGTGASAIQFVPEVQKVAAHLTVFQRTAPWVLPKADRPTSERRRTLFTRMPALQRLAREAQFLRAEVNFLGFRFKAIGAGAQKQAAAHLRKQIADPQLRAKLTPDYRIGCKRILISNTWYPALAQANVDVVTDSVTRVEGKTLVCADGVRREFDVIIVGTGFNATEPPVAKLLFGATQESLAEVWTPHLSALRGTTVAGFPNLYMLIGPNTVLGHNSMISIIEAQLEYVLQALDAAPIGSLDTLPAAQIEYTRRMQRDLAGSVWLTGGCSSYYLDATGHNTTIWPHTVGAFRRTVSRFDRAEFVAR